MQITLEYSGGDYSHFERYFLFAHDHQIPVAASRETAIFAIKIDCSMEQAIELLRTEYNSVENLDGLDVGLYTRIYEEKSMTEDEGLVFLQEVLRVYAEAKNVVTKYKGLDPFCLTVTKI